MSKRTYFPERGDLIEVNFQPAAGREIDKRRPAIVLTPLHYNRQSGFCIAVPISSQVAPGPLWIDMPPGYLPLPSQILCDLAKSLDYRERSAIFLNRVPEELVREIIDRMLDLLDPIP
ncbi:MAG TPA: type II toxin-antitoxin system PemK/MazF family toxin [Tepidisphaeraceae bacterium]|nr:type II toxin-antitoxin system PemK/MazF family toxin [Tepidisphaeraceae bacterium]